MFQSHPFCAVTSPISHGEMTHVAVQYGPCCKLGHSLPVLQKAIPSLQKPTPSLSQYLPRPSQREGARACGPGECSIASAFAVNTARGVERVSRFCACNRVLVCGGKWKNFERVSRLYVCIRGNVCGDIRKNIGRASHFCARIVGNVCGNIWRNTEFASNLRSPPSEGLGEVLEGLVSVSLFINLPASSTSSTFSTLFVLPSASCLLQRYKILHPLCKFFGKKIQESLLVHVL